MKTKMKNVNEIFDKEGSRVEILGLTGLLYQKDNEKYFIDSELLNGKEHDIVIFQDKIRYYEIEDKRIVDESKKSEIIKGVLALLSSNDIKTMLL
ncbi:MAG: hypothetical protein JWN83_2882 [Chitinophagaceae bacterium]|nr:hypothetical protein [Chitinophagaceae bacterium]